MQKCQGPVSAQVPPCPHRSLEDKDATTPSEQGLAACSSGRLRQCTQSVPNFERSAECVRARTSMFQTLEVVRFLRLTGILER